MSTLLVVENDESEELLSLIYEQIKNAALPKGRLGKVKVAKKVSKKDKSNYPQLKYMGKIITDINQIHFLLFREEQQQQQLPQHNNYYPPQRWDYEAELRRNIPMNEKNRPEPENDEPEDVNTEEVDREALSKKFAESRTAKPQPPSVKSAASESQPYFEDRNDTTFEDYLAQEIAGTKGRIQD